MHILSAIAWKIQMFSNNIFSPILRSQTMSEITVQIPFQIQSELANINNNLDTKISAKPIDKNLLIATWNIRAFGEVTRKWERT